MKFLSRTKLDKLQQSAISSCGCLSRRVYYIKPDFAFTMETPDKHNEYMDLEEVVWLTAPSDIDNIINLNGYLVIGDKEEIKKIARAHGIINIGDEDIISTLSTTKTNYVTSGEGTGEDRVVVALNSAINRLPVKLQDLEKLIVNVWINACCPILMSEIRGMVKCLEYNFPKRDLIWGVSVDSDINEDIKITLIAVK